MHTWRIPKLGTVPRNHPFQSDFPWNKPSSYWGTPISIYGNPRRFRVNIGFWGHLYSDGNRRAKEGVTPLCFNANKHQNKPVTWESNSCCPCQKNLSMTCKWLMPHKGSSCWASQMRMHIARILPGFGDLICHVCQNIIKDAYWC